MSKGKGFVNELGKLANKLDLIAGAAVNDCVPLISTSVVESFSADASPVPSSTFLVEEVKPPST